MACQVRLCCTGCCELGSAAVILQQPQKLMRANLSHFSAQHVHLLRMAPVHELSLCPCAGASDAQVVHAAKVAAIHDAIASFKKGGDNPLSLPGRNPHRPAVVASAGKNSCCELVMCLEMDQRVPFDLQGLLVRPHPVQALHAPALCRLQHPCGGAGPEAEWW